MTTMPYGPPIEHFEFLLQLLPCSVVKEEERTFNLSCLPTDGILVRERLQAISDDTTAY